MIVRQALISDKREITLLAKTQAKRIPQLKLDVERLNDSLSSVIQDAHKHFVYVVEDEGKVVGTLIAVTGDNAWCQRQNSNVMLWVSDVSPGGAMLLKAYYRWIKARRAVKIAGLSPNIDLDKRTLRLMELLGFERHGGSFLLYN